MLTDKEIAQIEHSLNTGNRICERMRKEFEAELREYLPADWEFSLTINPDTLKEYVLIIEKAPIDVSVFPRCKYVKFSGRYELVSLNRDHMWSVGQYANLDAESKKIIYGALEILNRENNKAHDWEVVKYEHGWDVTIALGNFDKEFVGI